jgi:hypothetical protein
VATDDARDLVELRIHGVSGTPPESMLEVHFTKLVTGDAKTGIYRADPDDQLAAEGTHRRRWLEGYSWRGMTSGSPFSALWVLVAPFAIANTVNVMRRSPKLDRVHRALARLLAVSLTVTLVMTAFIVAIDEVAWQCGNNRACTRAHAVTGYLGWNHLATQARRVAVTLVVPVAAILLLWWLARRAWNARRPVDQLTATEHAAKFPDTTYSAPLANPVMWSDREPSEFLRHSHVAASFAVIAAMTAVGLGYATKESHAVLVAFAWAGFAVLAVAVAMCVVGWGPRARMVRRVLSVTALIASAALVLGEAVFLYLADPAVDATKVGALPGVERTIVVVFTVQLLTILAIGLSSGRGGGTLTGIAVMLGALFSAGVSYYASPSSSANSPPARQHRGLSPRPCRSCFRTRSSGLRVAS